MYRRFSSILCGYYDQPIRNGLAPNAVSVRESLFVFPGENREARRKERMAMDRIVAFRACGI